MRQESPVVKWFWQVVHDWATTEEHWQWGFVWSVGRDSPPIYPRHQSARLCWEQDDSSLASFIFKTTVCDGGQNSNDINSNLHGYEQVDIYKEKHFDV